MKKEDVVGGMLAYIAHLREVGRYSTAKSYLDALRSFKCFCGMEEIPYAYIDKERLLLYQAWLSKRGCMRNTVSTYMRRIRHIYNLAVEAGEVSYIPNLFKGVFTGVESKRKKALPLDSLRSLMGTPRVEPEMRRTQLCFLPDVLVQRDGVRGFRPFAERECQGRGLVVPPSEERGFHPGGDPGRCTALVG